MKPFALLLSAILSALSATADPIRVLVWDEQQPAQKTAYGEKFLGETIAEHLARQPEFSVKSASLDAPGQGLEEATLDSSDVLIWWGHVRHTAVTDASVERVISRVKAGKLGFIALHSAHWSRPFVALMQERAKVDAMLQIPASERATAKLEFANEKPIGRAVKDDSPPTPALEKTPEGTWKLNLPQCVFPSWRADGAPGHMTTLLAEHPIAKGLPAKWDVRQTEMYNEPFHVPKPDAVIFEERWDKGERFRSGCVWKVGQGRVFYFRPGHETYPVYQQAEPLRVLENALRWLAK